MHYLKLLSCISKYADNHTHSIYQLDTYKTLTTAITVLLLLSISYRYSRVVDKSAEY